MEYVTLLKQLEIIAKGRKICGTVMATVYGIVAIGIADHDIEIFLDNHFQLCTLSKTINKRGSQLKPANCLSFSSGFN